jgi:ABC-type polysaccharide/polyol phosphate export permease
MTTSAFIFANVFNMNLVDFTIHMFVGMSVWSIFATTVHQSSGAMMGNENILKKISVKPIIFPIVSMLAAFIEAIPMIIISYIIVIFFGLIDFFGIFKVIGILILIAMFSLGLGMMLSIACIKFRDLQYIISVILQIWFYATPILYKGEMLGNKFTFLMYINPMANYLTLIREQQTNYNDKGSLSLAISTAVVTLLLGFIILILNNKKITKKL